MDATRVVKMVLLGAGVAAAGCGREQAEVTGCEDGSPCGAPQEAGWSGPVLLWSGPEGEAPPCPEAAPQVVYEGHDGLTAQASCPTCTCGTPSCMLPEGVITSSVADCVNYDVPGAKVTHYMAPDGWTGECVSPTIVDPENVKVVIMLPSRVSPCEPITEQGAMAMAATWTTVARACQIEDPATALDAAAPFARCVYQEGELATCPAGYPERQVFYGGVTSTLSCSPCSCGPPEGSACATWLRWHEYEPCPSMIYSATWIGMTNGCALYPAGDAGGLMGISAVLGSNQANEAPHVIPGSCEPSGGEPTGQATPDDPTTFCCEPGTEH